MPVSSSQAGPARVAIALCLAWGAAPARAQTTGEPPPGEEAGLEDPTEIAGAAADAGPEQGEEEKEEERTRGWVLLPGVYYTPERGLIISGAVLRYFRPASSDERLSRIALQAGASFDGRAEIDLDPELYLRNNRLVLDGSSQLTYFDYSYYGIGNDTPESAQETYTALRFDARVEVIHLLVRQLYAGLVYDIRYQDIRDLEPGGALAGGAVRGTDGGFLSGAGGLIRWDSRDHSVWPTRGGRVTFSPRFYRGFLGSGHDFDRWLLDASWFFHLGGEHVLGIDGRLDLRTGDPPFDHLSMAGGSRLLRGIIEGRWRDDHYLAAQAEYRYPIYWRFSGVAFAGLGRVAGALDELSFEGLKYSVGGGLRFAVNPEERINVRLDVGVGTGDANVYFRILEAF